MNSLMRTDDDGRVLHLLHPTAVPSASAWLYSEQLLLNISCQGYARVRYLEPEAASYSRSPVFEANTFMQPEQPYHPDHPGRFFYLRDDATGEYASAPYAPVGEHVGEFDFEVSDAYVRWRLQVLGIDVSLTLRLASDHLAEHWQVCLHNAGDSVRELSLYPCFSLGYHSWMNQGAAYDASVQGIVASHVIPYQALQDLPRVLRHRPLVALSGSETPHSWTANWQSFCGAGGLARPDAMQAPALDGSGADYELPIAALQYRCALEPCETRSWSLMFGAAHGREELAGWSPAGRSAETALETSSALLMATPDRSWDTFCNHWLPRQVNYHGRSQRFASDPQTRNYLQDAMGMVYLEPELARRAVITLLSQQLADGGLPDGVLLHPDAKLEHINTVPHHDHPVWLPLVLRAYVDETGDTSLLADVVDGERVAVRVSRAMDWLLEHRDQRGLIRIGQGDWCDPMNQVGPGGVGVSSWLTQAAALALQEWGTLLNEQGLSGQRYLDAAASLRDSCNQYCWFDDRYCRGITDAGRPFGIAADAQGSLYLNAQSWAILSGCADSVRSEALIALVQRDLATPYGLQMLAPAYEAYESDIGRLTQKYPGTAENGSVYNHAVAFYVWALYRAGHADEAFQHLRTMIPASDDEAMLRHGQMPCYLPNYYRGDFKRRPRTAGRSSGLHHTGTGAWFYRLLIEQLFGLRGCADGLYIAPALPSHWIEAGVLRDFRGATMAVQYRRERGVKEMAVSVNGTALTTGILPEPTPGKRYDIQVLLPYSESG